MPRRGAFFFIGKKIIFVAMIKCKEKKKTKGIKFGKNNLGGKDDKKGEKKIGETGKNVIKTHFSRL